MDAFTNIRCQDAKMKVILDPDSVSWITLERKKIEFRMILYDLAKSSLTLCDLA